MKWKRAKKQRPEHGEEVLVRCRGMIELAVYDEQRSCFCLKSGKEYDEQDDVYWFGVFKGTAHQPH